MKLLVKIALALSLLIVFVGQSFGQLPNIDWSTVTSDNVFEKLIDPVLMGLYFVSGLLSRWIPSLQTWDKARWTLVSGVIITLIAVFGFKVAIGKAIMSFIATVLGYNNVVKQAIDAEKKTIQ